MRGAFDAKLSDFLQDFPTPMCMEDSEGVVVFANAAYVTLLNTKEDRVIGHKTGPQSALFQPVRSEADNLSQPGQTPEAEVLCKLVTDDIKECMVLGKPKLVTGEDGNEHTLWSLCDISLFVSYEQELEDKHRELRKQQSKLKELAAIDPLTGIANRRSFYDKSEELLTYAEIGDLEIGVLMLDLDNFKNLNDTHGHAAGDEVLIAFTKLIEDCVRGSDVVARLGGEEFAILLPDAPEVATRRIAQRIIDRTGKTKVKYDGQEISFTTSVGGTMWMSGEDKIDIALNRADKNLYIAKDNGRNQLEFESCQFEKNKVA
ncbi:MAG: diguanylate cyclase [Hyphomicrobiales bacterium]